MSRTLLALACCLAWSPGCLITPELGPVVNDSRLSESARLEPVRPHFRTGETLSYTIHVCSVPAGSLELRVGGEGDGASLWAKGSTNALFNLLRPMQGRADSAVNANGTPRSFRLQTKSSSGSQTRRIVFSDPPRLSLETTKGDSLSNLPLPAANPVDPLGFLWSLRQVPPLSKPIDFEVHSGVRPECHRVTYLGRTELKTATGTRRARVFEVDIHPLRSLTPQPILAPKRSTYTVCISDDAERIPLRLESKLKVGSLVVEWQPSAVEPVAAR